MSEYLWDVLPGWIVAGMLLWLTASTFGTRRGQLTFLRMCFPPKPGKQFSAEEVAAIQTLDRKLRLMRNGEQESVKDSTPCPGKGLKVAGTDAETKFEVAPVVVKITRQNCLLEAQALRGKLQAACSMLPSDSYRDVSIARSYLMAALERLEVSPDFQLNFPLTDSGSDSGEPTQPAGAKENQ